MINSKKYKVLFFDLDHTLWDYNANSKETLSELHAQYLASHELFTLDAFLKTFYKINNQLWHKYNKGVIDKTYIRENRFDQIFTSLDIHDKDLSSYIAEKYLFECPKKPYLIPHTKLILETLYEKYPIYILTNGFEDIQNIKLKSSDIGSYFRHVITPDGCGYQKPNPIFFNHALELSQYNPEEALMIGDNLKTDIAGALNVGIDTVYFNPSQNGRPHRSTFEIASLDQLLKIIG